MNVRRHGILLVEDEVGIRDAFAMLLELEGYAVHVAVDGQDALDVLARTPVDLVLTDYMMPRLDGLALARELRRRGHDIPVVLITAASGGPPRREEIAAVLTKPLDITALLRTVEALLAAPQKM